MHCSHVELQNLGHPQIKPLRGQSLPERQANFIPVHVAAALAACEGRFLAASAGSATNAASIPVIASVVIRMIPFQFQRYLPTSPGSLVSRISGYVVQLSTFLDFPNERFDWRKRSANDNRVSGGSQMPPGTVRNATRFYMQVRSVNDALLHVFQHIDFGALGAEALDDCAFVGSDGIGRNVIADQIVTTDLQYDDVRPGRHGGI
jgi:hypothetical protein